SRNTTQKDDGGTIIKALHWKIGDLASGGQKTVGFTIRVTPDFLVNTAVVNSVYAVSSTVGQPPTGADGRTAPFSSTVVPAYSLTGTATPASVLPGGLITYTLTFTNLSSQMLTKVDI